MKNISYLYKIKYIVISISILFIIWTGIYLIRFMNCHALYLLNHIYHIQALYSDNLYSYVWGNNDDNIKCEFIECKHINDTELELLLSPKYIKSLYLYDMNHVKYNIIDKIFNMNELELLYISNTKLPSIFFENINKCGKLIDISIVNCEYDESNLSYLKLNTKLRSISLMGSSLSNNSINYIINIMNLQEINLDYTNITDKCLPLILSQKNLNIISVRGMSISDKYIGQINNIHNLERLIIGKAKISNNAKQILYKNVKFPDVIDDEN
jgi:hypothetical protein